MTLATSEKRGRTQPPRRGGRGGTWGAADRRLHGVGATRWCFVSPPPVMIARGDGRCRAAAEPRVRLGPGRNRAVADGDGADKVVMLSMLAVRIRCPCRVRRRRGGGALRKKPGGKPASPNRNRHTRLTIPVLWHPLGIDCRPPLTAAHRRRLLPTSHFIGLGEGLNKGRQEGVPPRT